MKRKQRVTHFEKRPALCFDFLPRCAVETVFDVLIIFLAVTPSVKSISVVPFFYGLRV